MRSLLEFLGLKSQAEETALGGETATVRKIVRELEELGAERARFIACFAYLLSRVAHADLDISPQETHSMENIVRQFGDLPESQAVLVVEIAKNQARLFGGTENFKVARELKGLATRKQCEELLHCLFAVSAADGSISGAEEQQVRLIAEELGLSHGDYIEIRTSYNEQRSVVQRLRER